MSGTPALYWSDSQQRIQVYHGDSVEFMRASPAEAFGSVITDPPYLRKYLHLYTDTAREASRFLVPGGSLLAIVPHFALPHVLTEVGQYLKYRWTFAMWQKEGKHPRMAMGIEVLWKPVVWWVKGKWKQGQGFVRDGFANEPAEKRLHQWQQSLSWGLHSVSSVAMRPGGQPVLDPFAGSGTVGEACLRLGVPCTLVELDEGHCQTIVERIERVIREGVST